MKEATGGDGHKSACNLFYMSKHVADMIEQSKLPVFSHQRANALPIPTGIKKDITQRNADFSLKHFQYQQT